MGFLLRVLVNALAIILVASVVPGIEVTGLVPAIAAGLILGLINGFIRPILILLTLPFTILTLGLFLFILNALCLELTSALVKGFVIHGFGSALLGALIVSVVSWILTALISDRGKIAFIHRKGP
ncbi:MAG: phage holin family protein [Pseudomonadota bacterium]